MGRYDATRNAPYTHPMAGTPEGAAALSALQLAKTTGIPIVGKLTSNQRVGSLVYFEATFAHANTDTTFDINLDRTPNGFLPFGSIAAGVPTIGSMNKADWQPGVIVLQAPNPGTYQLLIG